MLQRSAGVRRKRTIPRGTTPIRVRDRFNPEREHLVAAQDRRHVFFFRRQEDWHYKVPKAELLGPDLAELMEMLETEAARDRCLPTDVARRLIAALHTQQREGDGARILATLAPAAQRLGIPVARLAEQLEPLAEVLQALQDEARDREVPVREVVADLVDAMTSLRAAALKELEETSGPSEALAAFAA